MKETIQVTACSHTDPGRVRSHNEDACLVDEAKLCFLAADGMGGAAAGEVASGLMRETVKDLFFGVEPDSAEQLREIVADCFETANHRILEHAERVPASSGMGCTAELLAFCGGDFVLGHVGDSRTYLFRSGRLEQLTKDHTLVQDQEDQGLITREQAEKHAYKHIILRVVGSNQEIEVDFLQGTVLSGDIFLLCTDGLTTMVRDDKIEEIMAFNGPPVLKATMLVDQANFAGGKDNVSVVLVEVR